MIASLYRWAVHDRRAFAAAFHLGVVVMGVAGALFMVVTLLSAHWAIDVLFGDRYEAASSVLMLLAVGLPIRFIQSAYSALFVSRNETRRKAAYLGGAALVAAATSCVLIPVMGIAGAAIANVLAEASLLGFHLVGTARYIDGISITSTASLATLRDALAQMHSQARDASA